MTLVSTVMVEVEVLLLSFTGRHGEVLNLLGIWRGASFAVTHQTGFGEPSKGAPHGSEIACFAADA